MVELFCNTYISVGHANHDIFYAKVGKDGISSNIFAMHKVQKHAGTISKLVYGFASVRATIHLLKLVSYNPVQRHKSYINVHVSLIIQRTCTRFVVSFIISLDKTLQRVCFMYGENPVSWLA